MRKCKTLILILMALFCLSFKTINISAEELPPCNIGSDFDKKQGYGYALVRVDKSAREGVDTGQIWICKNSDCSGSTTLTNGWTTWSEKTRNFYVEYDAGPGNKITEISYTLYGEYEGCDDCALCIGKPAVDISDNNGIVQIDFSIEQGHVKKISATGKYIDSNGDSKDFPIDFFNIRKKLGSTNAVENTTSKSSDLGADTTLPKADTGSYYGASSDIYSTTNNYSAGIAKATSSKEMTKAVGNNDMACNTVGELFDDYWPYVMVIVPVLLIVMISIDFFKAMSSNDAEALTKASSNTLKRTIATIIILALPALLKIIFDIMGLDFCL